MPTPREIILQGPHNLEGLSNIDKVNRIFDNFCIYGRDVAMWRYDSTGAGDEGQVTSKSILNGTNNGIVYCEPLVYAFMELAEEALEGTAISVKQISHPPCILHPGYTCIDPRVVGNIRTSSGAYSERKQCFFSAKHVYCKVGQNFYDPCFATKYGAEGEPIFSDTLVFPSKYTYPDISDFVIPHDHPDFLLMKVEGESPNGFKVGYVNLGIRDLSKRQFEQLMKFYEDQSKTNSQRHLRASYQEHIKAIKRQKIW